jgi:hypothetical protein
MRVDESGVVQSIRARLLTVAASSKADPNAILTRYGVERFLYRFSLTPDRDRFVLKGAMLVSAWLGMEARSTRDADLLGYGDLSPDAAGKIARNACQIACPEDGMSFDPASVKVEAIRTGQLYGGIRLVLQGNLGRARVKVQVDIGTGDATVPPPTRLEYPSLLGLPRPSLRVYRPESVVAEKVHAMVVIGAMNSRLKDVFDVAVLSGRLPFDGPDLVAAIVATFERRQTPLPGQVPPVLEERFARDPERVGQWGAFLRRLRISPDEHDFGSEAAKVRAFVGPALEAARLAQPWTRSWPPGGPWIPADPTTRLEGRS